VLAADPTTAWVDVALDAGYSDQPHLARDFRELAGLTPSRYRALAPDGSRHVRIG
jgi:AraC-like DNA-binding protein